MPHVACGRRGTELAGERRRSAGRGTSWRSTSGGGRNTTSRGGTAGIAFGAVAWGYHALDALLAERPAEVFERVADLARLAPV